MKPGSWIGSLNCAIEGILWAVKTQRHMLLHLFAALLVLVLSLAFKVAAFEFLLIALALTLVLFAELVNTAIEVVVDLVSPEYHPLAKRAKDVAAGAVLLAGCGALILGYLAFSSHVLSPSAPGASWQAPPPGALALASLLVVMILVVLIKARIGLGRPLSGGTPSGHAAVAFSILVLVVSHGAGPVPILLVLLLAVLVAHSRILLGIHSIFEVLAGVLLGTVVTWLMVWIFK